MGPGKREQKRRHPFSYHHQFLAICNNHRVKPRMLLYTRARTRTSQQYLVLQQQAGEQLHDDIDADPGKHQPQRVIQVGQFQRGRGVL